MSSSKVQEALDALESRDWSGAEAVTQPAAAQPMVTVATRLPVDLLELLTVEAGRRGINPSALLRDLAEDALRPVPDSVTVRLVDVVRAVEMLGRHAA